MPIPYSMLNLKAPAKDDLRAWDDPRRKLYPNHAEFWPEDIPEHIVYQRKAISLRRWKRRAWLLSLVRFEWLRAMLTLARNPSSPAQILEDPMTPQWRSNDRARHHIVGVPERIDALKAVAPDKAQPVCDVNETHLPASERRAGCR